MEKKRETGIGSGGGVLPEDLLMEEVLTWLPGRSLMQFKCVSKLWCSTISSSPSFCNAHRARSRSRPSLLMSCSLDGDDPFSGVGFFSAAHPPCLSGGGLLEWRHVFTVGGGLAVLAKKKNEEAEEEDGAAAPAAAATIDRSKYYHGVTEVIKSLFCLYFSMHDPKSVAVCNVSTGEIMELPPAPPAPLSAPNHQQTSKYFLGFASSRKEYKLLSVSSYSIAAVVNHQRVITASSQILTLGDTAWRSLQLPAPPVELNHESVYTDDGGTCYWWCRSRNCLVAFSFEEEKFRQIYGPPTTERLGGSLHQCGGYLAMTTGLMDRRIKLWVLDKYVPESPPSQSVHAWTLHHICIPDDFADLRYFLLGNLPTGEMLMTGAEQGAINSSGKSLISPVYSYNPTERTFKRFVTYNKFPSSLASIRNHLDKFHSYYHKPHIYYHEEDITPLNRLLSNGQSQ